MDNSLRCLLSIRSTVLTATVFVMLAGPVVGLRADAAVPASGTLRTRALAEELVKRGGVRRGICAVLGSEGNLALEIAQLSELLVHVRTPAADEVSQLQKFADEAGFSIDRLAVERGSVDKLPYADNMVDVLVTRRPADELRFDEVLRVLRPEGTALIGDPQGRLENLKQWIRSSDVLKPDAWKDASGAWIQFSKPPLQGAGQWSHWEHGPDNNPVSEDAVIKAPYMTQFLAKPLYIAMPSITTAAGGRTFLAIGHIAHHRREWDMMNRLIARNGYNGTVLWERKLPEGYLVHRSAFIATNDVFYMIDGDHCLLLDPQTGEETGAIRIPGVDGEWKWMVLNEGVLYVLAGNKDPGVLTTKGDRAFGGWSWADLSKGYYSKPHVPWGFGQTLAAYDLQKKQLVWKHTEDTPIDSRAMSLGNERIYLYCPEQHLRGLNLNTGAVEWTNADPELLKLIEEPGQRLISTPGFRTACLTVFTPKALIIQGQTRQNVVAVSPSDGYLLWTRQKVTNNPNAIYVDGTVVLGVGPGGTHVALDPVSGEVLEDLKFLKRACTRLTACSDSFFVRGEGTLRFDRDSRKVLIDGSVRPACNDGALPANGLLYLGPWQCDCNLSLIGRVAECSAGDFQFDRVATEAERLQVAADDLDQVAPLATSESDWPTYRGSNHRTASTTVRVAETVVRRWEYVPRREHTPTVPTSAGGLVFMGGEDGKVRALDAQNGQLRWEHSTPSPIKAPPTIAEGRAYFGSGDGYAYALEAATGRLLWRFRAAPVERHIMVYGSLASTWPVNSGVLVQDGTAYFAAGIIDHDGTYVYAVDAVTGEIKWQNISSGHLSEELRKGVSAQGNLTIRGDQLLLAGGNQVSPAPFDLRTGECLAPSFDQGQPKANHGQFVGVLADRFPIVGGRILYSAPENVSTKGSFAVLAENRAMTLNFGGIPPAWDDQVVALVNFKHGKLTCFNAEAVAGQIAKGLAGPRQGRGRFLNNVAASLAEGDGVRWQSDLGESNKFEAVSLAVAPNAVVAVVQFQQQFRSQPQWYVVAFDKTNGQTFWRQELNSEPLPGGLLVDRDGQVVLTLLNGSIVCLGQRG